MANSLLPLLPLLPVKEYETDVLSGNSLNVMSDTITKISKLIKRQACESMKPVVVPSDPNAGSSDSAPPTNETSTAIVPVSFYDNILITYNSIIIYIY